MKKKKKENKNCIFQLKHCTPNINNYIINSSFGLIQFDDLNKPQSGSVLLYVYKSQHCLENGFI